MLLLCADVRDVFTAVQDTHVLHSQPNMFSVCVSCSLSDGVFHVPSVMGCVSCSSVMGCVSCSLSDDVFHVPSVMVCFMFPQ